MIWGSGGSKSRLAKAAGAEPAGQMRDEKLHAVVARSTFASQNVQNTWCSEHFWKLRCRKSARRCGAKHISKSKCTNHTILGPLLEVQMSKKCTPLWREAYFQVKSAKTDGYGALLDVQVCFRVAGARDCAPWQKWAKREGFVAFSKTLAGVGHLKGIFKDALRVAGAVQKTCSSEMLGGQGADFLRGVAFWSIRSSGLLRWFCVTGAARRMTWHQFFVAGAVLYTGGVEKSQNALVRVCQLCTQLSIFEGNLAEFFVFDGLHFEKWGSLAELLRFGCCQIQKMKTSRRIVPFWTFLCSNIAEVSQKFFVFDLADR